MIPDEQNNAGQDQERMRIPLMQQLLDNPFLLLFLGVLVPMVVYTLWGVIDILTIPPAP
jgi:hypothetical protein